MKNLIGGLLLYSFALISCGDNSGGNKGVVVENNNSESSNKVIPAKESSYTKTLQWTAYKMKEKVPVIGTFNSISLTNTQEEKPILESLQGAKFSCDGTTVSTGDTARDGTLTAFFFKRLQDTTIQGNFGKFENNKVPITFILDGKTVTKVFDYTLKGKELTIKGSIDILKDFGAEKAFTSLHRACYDLHEGKTWTEVDIIAKISE